MHMSPFVGYSYIATIYKIPSRRVDVKTLMQFCIYRCYIIGMDSSHHEQISHHCLEVTNLAIDLEQLKLSVALLYSYIVDFLGH